MAKKHNRNYGVGSKILDLPKTIQEELNKRLLNKEFTLKGLKEYINTHPDNKNIKVSQSSVNRYAKNFDKQLKDMQDLEYLVNKLPKNMDFSKESNVYTLIAKILATKLYEKSSSQELDTKDLLMLSRSLKDILASVKDREKIKLELKKEVEKELKAKQAQELTKAKDSKQISKKSFDEAMRILGL